MSSASPSIASTGTARIDLRTSAEAKALIERAAALMDTTVSGFMRQHACDAARRVVADHDTLHSEVLADQQGVLGTAAAPIGDEDLARRACPDHSVVILAGYPTRRRGLRCRLGSLSSEWHRVETRQPRSS